MKIDAMILSGFLLLTAGCTRESPSPGPVFGRVETGSVNWSAGEIGKVRPGIDEAQVLYLGNFIVLWSDLPSRTATSIAYGSEGGQLGGGGQFINEDIGEIEVRYELKSRSSGTVVIAGESYDFSRGGLFLIAARHAPVEVLQVDCGLQQLEMNEESLRRLATSEPKIAEFFSADLEAP